MRRRAFFGAIIASAVAPAIVRASSLMRPRVYTSSELTMRPEDWEALSRRIILTPTMITNECLAVLDEQLAAREVFHLGRDEVVYLDDGSLCFRKA